MKIIKTNNEEQRKEFFFECSMNNQYPHLEITIRYELGGYSYFTGKQSRRGYYLAFQPCAYHGHVISTTMLGNNNESGIKFLLKEVTRKSKKGMQSAIEGIQMANIISMASRYGISTNDCCFIYNQIKK